MGDPQYAPRRLDVVAEPVGGSSFRRRQPPEAGVQAVAMSGIKAGTIVFVGIGIANLANYAFHLLTARYLGPSAYGDVATLSAIGNVLTLPLIGVQFFVARHVASRLSAGKTINDRNYVSGFASTMLLVGGAIAVVLLACLPAIRSAVSVHSVAAVAYTVLLVVPSFLAPVLLGAIQGSQRFIVLATAMAVPPVLRIGLVGAALHGGLGVAGAMGATLVTAVVAVGIPIIALRHALLATTSWRPTLPRREVRALLPVVAGMLAITCLSTDDLVAAKVALGAHEAGLYGAASLIGRLILYVPVAIVTVLIPKVSARVSSDRRTEELGTQSFVVTALFCIGVSLVYVAVPTLIVRIAYGTKYDGSARLLWMFAVAMTLYALLNVLLAYRLGHQETATSWVLLGAVVIQAVAFAAFHSSARELLTVSIATGAVALVVAIYGPSERSPASVRERLRSVRAER
jgi:O-antigen/teichoic acid export membrane protein